MTNPKKKIEIIFYLIKRMSRTEKRHFKLNNQIYKGGDKDFVRLFDHINKLKQYDKDKIEKFFIKKKMKNKNLCIGYLLTKLVENIDDGTIDFIDAGQKNIVLHMKNLRVYIKMELMDLAYKELLKVEQLAEKSDNFEYLFFVYRVWEELITATYIKKRDIEQVEELRSKRLKLIEKVKVNIDIGYAMRLFGLYPSDSPKFKEAYQLLLSYESYDFSPSSKMFYNHVLFWHSLKTKSLQSAFEYSRNCVEIFHQNPELISTSFEDFTISWHAMLRLTVKIHEKVHVEKYLKEYQQLPQRFSEIFETQPDALIVVYEMMGYEIELDYIIKTEQYNKTKKVSEKILQMLEKYTTSSRSSVAAMLLASLVYGAILSEEDADVVWFWFGKLSDLPHKEKIVLLHIDILELIILYEETSFTLFTSKIRSLKRKLKMTEHDISVAFMVKFLDDITKKRNQHKLPEIYEAGYREILKIEEEDIVIYYSKWIAKKM